MNPLKVLLDNRIAGCLLSILLLIPVPLHAARESLAEINFSTGGGFFSKDVSSKNTVINRIDFSLWFTHKLSLEMSYGKSFSEFGPSGAPDVTFYSASASYVLGNSKRFLPYIKAGYGRGDFVTDKVNDSFSLADLGTGVKYLIGKEVGLRFDVRDYITTTEGYHNFVVTLGLTYMLGQRPKKKLPETKVSKKEAPETEVSEVMISETESPEEQIYEAEELGLPVRETEKEDIVPAEFWRQRLKARKQPVEEETVAKAPVEKAEEEKKTTEEVTKAVSPEVVEKTPVSSAPAEKTVKEKISTEASTEKAAPEKEMGPVAAVPEARQIEKKPAPLPPPEMLPLPLIATPEMKEEEVKVQTKPKETEVEERVVPSVKEEVPPKETVKPLYGLILSVRQYYFAFNSPYPDPATRRQIDEFIEFLKDKDVKKIIIEGFACAHGPNWYNYYLSKKRALVVKNYLKKKLSLQDDVFEIKFYGERLLEVPELPSEAPESEHAKLNRRVVIKVLYKVE